MQVLGRRSILNRIGLNCLHLIVVVELVQLETILFVVVPFILRWDTQGLLLSLWHRLELTLLSEVEIQIS